MMSLRVRSAWISLATTLVIWGFYFFMTWRGLGAGEAWSPRLFFLCLIGGLVAQLALIGIAAARSPRSQRVLSDEREIRIDSRATVSAYVTLTLLVLAVAVGAAFVEAGALSVVLMAQGLILAVVAAEAVKCAVVLMLHRWSAS